MNKRFLPVFLLLFAVIGLSALISLLVVRANNPPRFNEPDKLDQWLHQQLKISPAQEAAMKPFEDEFHRQERQLVLEIRDLNQALAHALVTERQNSAKVQEIVDHIHSAQGRLQRLTISHIFDMRVHLDDAQYDRLLKHAAAALTESEAPPSAH
jgi:hypothetical protein